MSFAQVFDGSISDIRHKIVYDCVRGGFPASSRPFILTPEMRRLGLHIVAGRGSGKSRFLGRYLAYSDFVFDVPTIIFDTGDTIDNLLDRVLPMLLRYDNIKKDPTVSKEEKNTAMDLQYEFLSRVRYVNMAGCDGDVVPFPFYYRFGNESTAEVAQRFVEFIRRITPELQTASIEGFPPLERIANHAGRILFTLGLQVTEMAHLLTNIEAWQPRLREALAKDPSLADSVDFFRPKNQAGFRISRAEPLLTELDRLTATPTLRAMFGASRPGIDWQTVVDRKEIVLLDFREVRRNPTLYRNLMTAAFRYLMDFIQYRGVTRDNPVSVIVDEFSALVATPTPGAERIVINDMQLWLNELMRRHNMWLTLAHQELSPLSDKVQSLLLGMGNQLLGKVGDIEDALRLAKAFIPIDPHKVKRYDPILGQQSQMGIFHTYYDTVELGEKEVNYTIPEQHYTHAYHLQNLAPLHFLQRIPGTEMMGLADFSIAEFERGIYPDAVQIEYMRRFVMVYGSFEHSFYTERYVYNTEDVLAEIAERSIYNPSTKPPTTGQQETPQPEAKKPLPVKKRVEL